MRRRLIVVALAVTSMVVLAFVIPLGMLVRDLARDRALSAAEREAESVARFVAVVGAEQAATVGAGSEFEVSILLADGTVVGAPVPPDEDVAQARAGTAFRAPVPGGQAVYVPVLQPDGVTVVVRVFVGDSVLSEGVAVSWLTLGLLGIALIVIAVAISDRLARSVVAPVRELQATAANLSEGNLEARIQPSGPNEVRDVGVELNRLAERIEYLLQRERETAADLSHRLRTPLTAVRLDAEAMADDDRRRRLLDDLDELERHVDFVIREARRDVGKVEGATTDLVAVVAGRAAFWEALAEEQSRPLSVDTVATEVLIAMVDAIIGNVFAHTDEGVCLEVTLSESDGAAILRIEDAGHGFPDASVLERGRGHGTGLGLDIARRTAESAGGTLQIGRSPLGGAAVLVTIPRLA